ncbi:hypothetical protein OKW37_000422 [Paraburkholderia sp. MM5482-R2]
MDARTDLHSIDLSYIEGKIMAGNRSLRSEVEKLVGPTRGRGACVRLLDRSRSGGTCRVCIQIDRPSGTFSLFFFRHADGTRHVFPPGQRRPEMGIGRLAA